MQRKYGCISIYVEIIDDQYDNLNAFEIYKILKDTNIYLIESKSYFEAYVHVLKCMQEMNPKNLQHF